MQQATLESLVARLPSMRDIPSLSEDQAKQYFFMARSLLEQVFLIMLQLRNPGSRTVNNLKAILEAAYQDPDAICAAIEKEKKN